MTIINPIRLSQFYDIMHDITTMTYDNTCTYVHAHCTVPYIHKATTKKLSQLGTWFDNSTSASDYSLHCSIVIFWL